MEPIIGFGVNQLKVIVSIDRLRNEFYQNLEHSDPFQHVDGYHIVTTFLILDLQIKFL